MASGGPHHHSCTGAIRAVARRARAVVKALIEAIFQGGTGAASIGPALLGVRVP